MPSYEMLPFIFLGVEMLLFDNSVLKMYLMNTQLNSHIKSFFFFYLPHKAICRKYMIKRLIQDLFHIIPASMCIQPGGSKLCYSLVKRTAYHYTVE